MIGWVDAGSGASGDMLLGALVGAGVPLGILSAAVDAVAPEHIALRQETVSRNGFAATRVHVDVADSSTHRTWRDIEGILAEADLADPVRELAHAAFERLAGAESAVHGTSLQDVHFHEVGALDAIADVVGVCTGFEHLGLTELVVSPVAVGSGTIRGAHGVMSVPAPAVAELLRGVPTHAGPGETELCTPTGAALLTTLATRFGPQPPMTVGHVGVGAGGRDPEAHANVLRLFLGEPAAAQAVVQPGPPVTEPFDGAQEPPVETRLLETNVDDLDPRLWPDVITALLETGAADAWLTPILMKKGRPAHTLSVLVSTDHLDAVRTQVFRQTSTIGLREIPVGKTALDREVRTVEVDGQPVRVKLALLDGVVVNAQPEYVDVVAAASATRRPVKDVLADAAAAGRAF